MKKFIKIYNKEILEEETKEFEIKVEDFTGGETMIKIPPNYYNVLFYKNKIPSVPSGDFIEEINKSW